MSKFLKKLTVVIFLSMVTTNMMAGEDTSIFVKGDCVIDNKSGLTWQAVTTNQTYRFALSETDAMDKTTRCPDGVCEVSLYIDQINAQKLCDSDKWRLPSLVELETLLENDRISDGLPVYDSNLFIFFQTGIYLTGSLYQYDEKNKIWVVDFKEGKRYVSNKFLPFNVILVHN